MNNRRRLVIAIGACASVPGTIFAQAKKPPVVIGWLSVGTPETAGQYLAAFKHGLAALDWNEGAQFVIEARWAQNKVERLPVLMEEMAKRKPAVIVVGASSVAVLLAKTAPNIPIVQAAGTSPVQTGLANSLARPGGMVTGITGFEIDLVEKLIEALVEVTPTRRRIGVLLDGNSRNLTAWLDAVRRAAARYSTAVYFAYAAKLDEIEPAVTDLAKQGAQALVVMASPLFNNQRSHIVTLAQAQRWPIVASNRTWVEEGALISYGVDVAESYRRAAYFVDRILKGAKPGDLPIEQPMTFDLAVNMRSSRALGLTIPQTILVRATKVIE